MLLAVYGHWAGPDYPYTASGCKVGGVPTNALENPLVLPILGLLVEAPRHPYAVFTELRDRYGYLRVRNATVYTLLNRLTEAGWLEASRDGQGASLAPTPDGVRALADLVTRQISEARPADTTSFATALAYIGVLPADRATELLDVRREAVVREIARLERAVEDAAAPEIHMIEAGYLLASLRQDAAWLEETADRIRRGRLPWPGDSPGRH